MRSFRAVRHHLQLNRDTATGRQLSHLHSRARRRRRQAFERGGVLGVERREVSLHVNKEALHVDDTVQIQTVRAEHLAYVSDACPRLRSHVILTPRAVFCLDGAAWDAVCAWVARANTYHGQESGCYLVENGQELVLN